MATSIQLQHKIKQVAEKALACAENTDLSADTRLKAVRAFETEIATLQRAADAAAADEKSAYRSQVAQLRFAGGTNPLQTTWYPGGGGSSNPTAELSGLAGGLAAKGFPPVRPPQLDLDLDAAREVYDAVSRRKSLRVEIATKAGGIDDTTSIAPSTIPDFRLPPVPFRREPTRILDRLPTAATSAGQVEWFSAVGTSAAAPVAEGQLKPVSAMTVTANLSKATKIAHMSVVNEEVLQDFPAFAGFLGQDMKNGLIAAENNEILNSLGTGASNWPGLLNTTGILVRAKAAETYNHEVLDEAVGDLRSGASFADPDAVVMHPLTWRLIRREKDLQGRPIVDPAPAEAGANTILGLPVVETTQMPVGTALVGAFSESVMVYLRMGIIIETSNQHLDLFQRNQVAMIAEERLILTVPRPAGLCKVTGLV